MNRVSALATLVPKTCVRRLSVSQIKCEKADLSKIKRKQVHFQEENDIPVYLKGGSTDYALYFTTIGLIAFGVAASAHSAYKLATGK